MNNFAEAANHPAGIRSSKRQHRRARRLLLFLFGGGGRRGEGVPDNIRWGSGLAKLSIIADNAGRDTILARGREVVRLEAEALDLLAASLNDDFITACEVILRSRGRVVVSGMGKSGHIARKIAATLSATGTPSIYIHPAEAAHGDLGMITRDDVLLVMSNSGNTGELRALLRFGRSIGVPIIGMASRRSSLVIDHADVPLLIPATREACAANVAPTTSTTLQLALGDALAMAVMDMRGVTVQTLRSLHPGGSIALRLTPLREIMRRSDALPLVPGAASMPDAITAMTDGAAGIVGVVDEAGCLIGVITDGDLRRHYALLTTASAADIMTAEPKTLWTDTMAGEALIALNHDKIMAAFVLEREQVNADRRPVGLVHVHDFLQFGLV